MTEVKLPETPIFPTSGYQIAEDKAVVARPNQIVQFHLQGQHDQSTHGNRAGASGEGTRWVVNDATPYWFDERLGDFTNAPWAMKHYGAREVGMQMTDAERAAVLEEVRGITVTDMLGPPIPPDANIVEIIEARNSAQGDPFGIIDKTRSDMLRAAGVSFNPGTDWSGADAARARFNEAFYKLDMGTLMQIDATRDFVRGAELDVGFDQFTDLLADYGMGRSTPEALSQELADRFNVPVEAAAVSFFHRGWQSSSASIRSQVAHDAASRLFGVPEQSTTLYRQFAEEYHGSVRAEFETARSMLSSTASSVVASSHRLTQEMLSGRDEISLTRGTSNPNVRFGSDMITNPLSSWTTDASVASRFAKGAGGALIQSSFPVSEVVGWHGIGFGSANEREFIPHGSIIPLEEWSDVSTFALSGDPLWIDSPEYGGPDWLKSLAEHEELAVEVFHLRGQHDQQSHAGDRANTLGDVTLDDLDGEFAEASTDEIVERFKLDGGPREYPTVSGGRLYLAEDGRYVTLDPPDDDGVYVQIHDDLYDAQSNLDLTDLETEVEDAWREDAARSIVYHGTRNGETAEAILSDGLQTMNETRGINNRWVGSAVYTTTEPEMARQYGNVFEVDLPRAIADGVISPDDLSREPGFNEADAMTMIAQSFDDYSFDAYSQFYGTGEDPQTVVIGAPIPVEYLKFDEDGSGWFSVQVFHLQGQHDQQSHAGGRAAVTPPTEAEFDEAYDTVDPVPVYDRMGIDQTIMRAADFSEGSHDASWAHAAYTLGGSEAMNKLLRGQDLPPHFQEEHREDAEILRKAIDESEPTKHDLVVYRGLGRWRRGMEGTRIRDDGFISTSLDRRVAETFGNVVEIRVPAGSKAIAGNWGEFEVILAPGTEFDVTEEGVLDVVQ